MEETNRHNKWNYNGKLKSFARDNRKNMTKAEACLWKYVLSRKQLMGYGFNRQRPVGNYIADFLCKDLMLIIEVDGLTHDFEEVAANDIIRQKELETMGFTVIRFTDGEVLNDMAYIERSLVDYIERYQMQNRCE